MKRFRFFFAMLVMLVFTGARSPRKLLVYGVFAGTTPCGNVIRPLHAIPLQSECALVQWKLVLYIDRHTRLPVTYQLNSTNRYSVRETNLYSEPGTNHELKGRWSMSKTMKGNNEVTLFRLETADQGKPVILQQLGDRLLHVLSDDGNLMIGNPFFSYTLTRIDN